MSLNTMKEELEAGWKEIQDKEDQEFQRATSSILSSKHLVARNQGKTKAATLVLKPIEHKHVNQIFKKPKIKVIAMAIADAYPMYRSYI